MVGIKDGLLDKTIKAPTYTVKELVQEALGGIRLNGNLAYRNALDLRDIKDRLGMSALRTRSAMGETKVFSVNDNTQTSSSLGRDGDTVWKAEEEKKKASPPNVWELD